MIMLGSLRTRQVMLDGPNSPTSGPGLAAMLSVLSVVPLVLSVSVALLTLVAPPASAIGRQAPDRVTASVTSLTRCR